MTEALLNNILQAGKNDFSPAKRKQAPQNSSRSFSETMQEINQRRQSSEKTDSKRDDSIKAKSSSPSDQEFLSKLRKILSKNNKEVPAELLALLQGGSLSSQQKAMLEQLMLNLKNNNLDVSDLKLLLAKNSDNQTTVNSKEIQFFDQEKISKESKTINPDQLEKLASLLETGDQELTALESSKLKSELDQLAKMLINSNSGKLENPEVKLQQILGTDNLAEKLTELASTLKKSDLSLEDLTEVSEQKDLKLPLLSQTLASESLNFSQLGETLSLEDNSSLFAELSAQLKEMMTEENNKVANQETPTNVDFSDTNIFSLNSDSTLELNFGGGELESKNQNNFFDLNNSNLLFNFDLDNQSPANNLNIENFSLNSENTTNLAENAELRSQVVEQFRGEYTPETKEMQIQLKPESLGKIDISLAYDNEKLTGKMLVESELVRAQLENSLKGLKSDLLKQGINIEQFKIETAKNAPQQVEKQNNFAFEDQDAAFSDGETGQNQEYEQRQFFQGQYYVQRNSGNSKLDGENAIMRQQEILSRAAFSNEKLNLLA
ncbi:flagellar hook-length control protein FliK [Halanaerobium saccharolyticum]|uniref:Flagellar hook-length control protein FliK n=1 Tax=Halanaerobium saccharolyticum TaxID=43595 RepID=A0A4R7YQC0_9FIRM|nr:flagellar hook-length control protein FliK [Halanaerobium saccharolyticum]RAK08899.1 flagellar hook-length control protein FliK [Halanaerobium saccharolyticum]TDV98939.1 flagellar hook-length control protein FliK [Halanaerobium saccharolyticum]TDX60662.1 flagellar hook-length control protein FliK [Halanaerobium saccharolyticum]